MELKPEKRFWVRARDAIFDPGLWLQRIENGVLDGMPDVLAIAAPNVQKWIELKVAPRVPVRMSTPLLPSGEGMRAAQIGWHRKAASLGVKSYILIGVETEKDLLWMVEGRAAAIVNECTVNDLVRIGVAFDWNGIREELLKHENHRPRASTRLRRSDRGA